MVDDRVESAFAFLSALVLPAGPNLVPPPRCPFQEIASSLQTDTDSVLTQVQRQAEFGWSLKGAPRLSSLPGIGAIVDVQVETVKEHECVCRLRLPSGIGTRYIESSRLWLQRSAPQRRRRKARGRPGTMWSLLAASLRITGGPKRCMLGISAKPVYWISILSLARPTSLFAKTFSGPTSLPPLLRLSPRSPAPSDPPTGRT